MGLSKKNQFTIPGIYGDIHVKVISRKTLRLKLKTVKKNEICNGAYFNEDHTIYIASELHGPARISTLTHEISHVVLDAAAELNDEELTCDMMGAYYHRLYNDQKFLTCLEGLASGK